MFRRILCESLTLGSCDSLLSLQYRNVTSKIPSLFWKLTSTKKSSSSWNCSTMRVSMWISSPFLVRLYSLTGMLFGIAYFDATSSLSPSKLCFDKQSALYTLSSVFLTYIVTGREDWILACLLGRSLSSSLGPALFIWWAFSCWSGPDVVSAWDMLLFDSLSYNNAEGRDDAACQPPACHSLTLLN